MGLLVTNPGVAEKEPWGILMHNAKLAMLDRTNFLQYLSNSILFPIFVREMCPWDIYIVVDGDCL